MVIAVADEPFALVAVIVEVHPEVSVVGVPTMSQFELKPRPVGKDDVVLQVEGIPPVLVTLTVAA
jgi:hypothetical protein